MRRYRTNPVEFSRFSFGFPLATVVASSRVPRRIDPLDLAVLRTEDRRLWNPAPLAAPGSLLRRARRVVPAQSVSGNVPVGLAFAGPRVVARCVRRRTRREVIMAKGKGGGRHRRPRRDYWSSVNC